MYNDGETLRLQIRGKGLTVEDAASAVKLSRGTLYNYFKEEKIEQSVLKLFKEKLSIDILQNVQFDNGKFENLQENEASSIVNEPEPSYHYSPAGRVKKTKGVGLVKFYDTDFAAGEVSFFEDNNNIEPTYFMDVPEFAGCTAFKTYGDSMAQLITSGSMLFAKFIKDWQSHLEYGQIYGIVCQDGRKYLKYIRKHQDEALYLLRSENKEYDDFDLPKEKIKAIWLIHGWINKKV